MSIHSSQPLESSHDRLPESLFSLACERWLRPLTAVDLHRRGRRAFAERTAMSDQMPIDTGQP
jgi:hypothetical protein